MLGADARAALQTCRFHDLRCFAEVDSTNRVAADLADQGRGDGVVVVADHQTAGRGRHGRSWEAPPATSLLVSALVQTRLAPDAAPLMTLAAAVAASDACLATAGIDLLLKWPNDLMAGDAKVGGILCELIVRTGNRSPAVVVGLGVNVNWDDPPPRLDRAVALSQLCGHPVDREGLLVAFLRQLERALDELASVSGRQKLLSRYRRRSATIGADVRVERYGGAVVGRAVDVDSTGRLVVQDVNGVRHVVHAGDVDQLRRA